MTAEEAAAEGWRYVIESNIVEDCGQQALNDFGGIYVNTNGGEVALGIWRAAKAISYSCHNSAPTPSSCSGYVCEASETCFIPTLVSGNLVQRLRAYNYGGNGAYAGAVGPTKSRASILSFRTALPCPKQTKTLPV